MNEIITLPIENISIDPALQVRVNQNPNTIADYTECMQVGDQFPPVTVFFDDEKYWLADGHLRRSAALQAGRQNLPVEIKEARRWPPAPETLETV
jgi:hypothetical protein